MAFRALPIWGKALVFGGAAVGVGGVVTFGVLPYVIFSLPFVNFRFKTCRSFASKIRQKFWPKECKKSLSLG